jgi:hypothetical protein
LIILIVRNQVISAAAIPAGGYVDLDVNTFRIPHRRLANAKE